MSRDVVTSGFQDSFGNWHTVYEYEGKRHPSSERFHEVLRVIGETHDLKSKDYGRTDDPFANVRGSTEWGMPAWMGAMIRATDKLRRLQTYALKGELANESVRDAFIDLACYSAIGLVLFEEEKEANP